MNHPRGIRLVYGGMKMNNNGLVLIQPEFRIVDEFHIDGKDVEVIGDGWQKKIENVKRIFAWWDSFWIMADGSNGEHFEHVFRAYDSDLVDANNHITLIEDFVDGILEQFKEMKIKVED